MSHAPASHAQSAARRPSRTSPSRTRSAPTQSWKAATDIRPRPPGDSDRRHVRRRPVARAGTDRRTHFEQLGEEGQLERLLEEAHARRSTGAALEADDAQHRAHVAEAPQLELRLHIDQVLAQRVFAPMRGGVLVDAFEHRYQRAVGYMRLRPVALTLRGGNGVTPAREIDEEF